MSLDGKRSNSEATDAASSLELKGIYNQSGNFIEIDLILNKVASSDIHVLVDIKNEATLNTICNPSIQPLIAIKQGETSAKATLKLN